MSETALNQEPISDALTSTLASFNYEYEELVDEQIDLDTNKNSFKSTTGGTFSTSTDSIEIFASTTALDSSLASSTVLSVTSDADMHDLANNDTYGGHSVAEFRSLMETRRNESNEFRVMIVCVGLVIVSLGLLSNLLFSLFIVCPNKRRPNRTPTQLIMLTMCLAYFIFLVFYCLKISIYFNGDNIIKFHIYDNIENWLYGSLMCKLISSMPIFVKLISRFSLLLIVVRRLVRKVYYSDLNRSVDDFSHGSPSCSIGETESDTLHIDEDTDLNILKNRRKYILNSNGANRRNRNGCSLQCGFLSKACRSPLIFLSIVAVWLCSGLSSLPVFSSYKLDENGICDSVHQFPDDIGKVAVLHFNYLLYGLVLPFGNYRNILELKFLFSTNTFLTSIQRNIKIEVIEMFLFRALAM
jgi:hypothetical protein